MKYLLFLLLIGFQLPVFSQADSSTIQGTEEIMVQEKMPVFPGGEDKLIKYIQKNVNYPKQARYKGIQGTVYTSFVVEKDGHITDVKVLRGIGGGCDEEALRVVSSLPNWTPGENFESKLVRVHFNLPIKFTLPEEAIKERTRALKFPFKNYVVQEEKKDGKLIFYLQEKMSQSEINQAKEYLRYFLDYNEYSQIKAGRKTLIAMP